MIPLNAPRDTPSFHEPASFHDTMASMPEEQLYEIVAQLPLRISDVSSHWTRHSPDRPALIEASGIWTYAQLESAVAGTQAWLRDFGIRPGDRVMIVCENCRAFVALLLAAARPA